jgi:hypothetical protein
VKLIESEEELQSWEDYREFLKVQLKLLAGTGESFFVSKQKVAFEIAGKPWNAFAVLLGPKGLLSARKLQKEGVIFREGTCGRDGKELRVDGLDPKLVKEAAKTLKKLQLGYKIAGVDAEGEEAPGGDGAPADGAAPPPARTQKLQDLRKLGSDLDRLLAALSR